MSFEPRLRDVGCGSAHRPGGRRLGPSILVLSLWLAGVQGCGAGSTGPLVYDPAQAVHDKFSGANALAWAKGIVGHGPRPSGSAALERTRQYLEKELATLGWASERQAFDETTPRGRIAFVNLRARFPGSDTWQRPLPLVVGSHYDTKVFANLIFVGANDGASGNAVMLELARVLATRPPLAARIELVFFDGEEAAVSYTPRDGLHGSRHYAKFLRSRSPEQRPALGLILDMVGDRDLRIRMAPNASQRLNSLALQAAADLGVGDAFGIHPSEILDDHVPLASAGLEVANFIDLDFPAWHTSADTLEAISAESLEIAGATAALLIEKYLLSR